MIVQINKNENRTNILQMVLSLITLWFVIKRFVNWLLIEKSQTDCDVADRCFSQSEEEKVSIAKQHRRWKMVRSNIWMRE